MKDRILKRISCIMIALVVTFTSAAIPAMNVHATEASAYLSIQALMQSILLASGMNTAGYKYTKAGVKQDFRIVVSSMLSAASSALSSGTSTLNPARINKALQKAEELSSDADFQSQLKDADAGTTFEYDDFKVSKVAENDYKLYVSKNLVGDFSKVVKQYAESSDNEYESYMIEALEDSHFDVKYSSLPCYNSLDSISDLYSSDLVSALDAKGYNDSNCLIASIVFNSSASCFKYIFSDFSECLHNVQDSVLFLCVPFGYSFISKSVYWDNKSSSGTEFRVYSSDTLFNYNNLYDSIGANAAFSKLNSSIPDVVDVLVYYPNTYDYEWYSLDYSIFSTSNVSFGNTCLFNYSNAVRNNTFYIFSGQLMKSNFYSYLYVPKDISKSSYFSSSNTKKYSNSSDYVEMEFDSDTVSQLDSYESISDLTSYVSSLSAQLADLKDAIDDASESNKEQTQQLITSIETQTKVISDGMAEVVTSVKAQTDALDDVVDAVNSQTGTLQNVITGINDQTLAITEPLQDILSELRDLTVTLPSDLTLTIPEEKLNVNVSIPDISTEVINNIEVKHDYAALQDSISLAMTNTLSDVFVPSAEVVDPVVNNFYSKFGFVDDIKTNISNMKSTFLGITPSPYLKIPIMKVKSDYDYGFGDYFILDLSWYEPYKPYGDKLISAFIWLFFIWRMFTRLPAIINGAAATTVMTIDTIGSVPKGTDEHAWSGKTSGEFGAKQWLE